MFFFTTHKKCYSLFSCHLQFKLKCQCQESMEEGLEIFFYASLFHFNVHECFTCIYVQAPHAYLVPTETRRIPWNHVGAGNLAWVLWKNSHFYLLSHLSSRPVKDFLLFCWLLSFSWFFWALWRAVCLNRIWLRVPGTFCCLCLLHHPDLSVSPCSTLPRRAFYMQSGEHSAPKTIF